MTVKLEKNSEVSRFCPVCENTVKLIVKENHITGHHFLGCPNYPECDYTAPIPEEFIMRAQGQKGLFDDKEIDQ